MPSEAKTPNIGLNQWTGNEYPKRQDYIDDNLIIDTEIGNLKKIALGAVADLAALKAINTTNIPDNITIIVKTLGFYRFDSTSAMIPNDTSVVQPTTGPGRWINDLVFHKGDSDPHPQYALDTELAEHETEITSLQNEVQNSIPAGTVALSNSVPVTSIDAKVNGGLDFESEAQSLVVNYIKSPLMDKDTDGNGRVDDFIGVVGSGITATLSVDPTEKAQKIDITASTTVNTAQVAQNNIPFIAGDRLSMQIETKIIGDVEVRILAEYRDTSNAYLGGFASTYTSPTVWGKIQVEGGTAPANTVYINVIVAAKPKAIGDTGTAWFKNVQVEKSDKCHDLVIGIQPMMGLDVKAIGKNLFDKSDIKIGYVLGSANNEIANTSGAYSNYINVKPNQDYKISGVPNSIMSGGNDFVFTYDKNRNFKRWLSLSIANIQFTTASDEYYVRFDLVLVDLDTAQLEEGLAITAYEPYQGSELLIDGEFAGIETYMDKLSYRNGIASVLRNVKKVILDGSLDWAYVTTATGLKVVGISVPGANYAWQTKNTSRAMKYDGKILIQQSVAGSYIDMYGLGIGAAAVVTDPDFIIGISQSETGWGDSITPTVAEIKAFMNGWKMNNGTFETPYNGTGTKTWTKWNATDNTEAVTVVPTTKADGWIAWATLWYALATPVEEILDTPINGLSVYEGKTTISVRTGIVEQEFTPVLYSGNYYVNSTAAATLSKLNYKVNKILGIYKNNVLDSGWSIGGSANAYGKEVATLPQAQYDSTATYKAKCEVLHEEYNSQQVSFTAEYTENLRDSHNELVITVENIQAELGDLWTSLLPLADKELAMSVVALLTTETTTDIKNKVNEILNIWR